MQKRHRDRFQYFSEQREGTQKYVIPYIQRYKKLGENCRVLEVGCGEGGNLYPFAELGCRCYGVELRQQQVNNATEYYSGSPVKKQITLFCQNIYDANPQQFGGKFDVIFLRDVIEHIPNQEIFMGFLKDFLLPDGVIFFAFPPWRNPFGGHQQICKSRILSHLPYFHLLPKKLYSYILQKNGEGGGLLDVRSTGISIARFERILKAENYRILKKTSWLFNPNYQVKYGLPPTKVLKIFQIPHLQDFYTTAMYYVAENRSKSAEI
jgi:SAM-dependent methyltransferase